MSTYAAKTEVSVEKSRAELERTLTRYGATAFAYAMETGRAAVMFEMRSRRIRFIIDMPRPDERRFTHYKRSQYGEWFARTESAAQSEWEQGCRQIWRALNLVVKAKLEAVEAGISEFEEEFLAHILLPNGSTVYEQTKEGIAYAYDTGTLPALMPGSSS